VVAVPEAVVVLAVALVVVPEPAVAPAPEPPAGGAVAPLPAVVVDPGAPVPAVHDPVVGVGTGAVDVNLGVVMTSPPVAADPVPVAPLEGSVVDTVVVSVRP
jgi:hypothetical protein